MYCRYGLQISGPLREYRRRHRMSYINAVKAKGVTKELKASTEASMRKRRQQVIQAAKMYREETGTLDLRHSSYFHRLLDIDAEDAKGGASVAYIDTSKEDEEVLCPSSGTLMEAGLTGEHQVLNCPADEQSTQENLALLASESAS